MTFARSLMTMRMRVQRDHSTNEDRWGRAKTTSQVEEATYPCRAWNPSDDADSIDGQKDGVFGRVRIATVLDADVIEGDTILDVTNRRGMLLWGSLKVIGVTRTAGHLAIVCRVQRSPTGRAA